MRVRAARKPDAQPAALAPLRIVLVDENQTDVDAAITALRTAGKTVDHVVALDCEHLQDVLQSFEPDVIVGDFCKPATDLAALRKLRADTPVVYLTAMLDEEQVVVALNSGAADFVLKSNLLRLPIAVDRAIRNAADRRRLAAELLESQKHVQQHTARLASLCRIAGNSAVRGSTGITAMLRESARSVRPHIHFRGILARVLDRDLLILSATPGRAGGAGRCAVGEHVPLAKSAHADAARTQSWNDTKGATERPQPAFDLGWRSAITTRFKTGADRYMLAFGSESPARFDPQDRDYVELLATSFAGQLERESLYTLLEESERRARLHAARLEVLWRIANNPNLHGKELWLTMLRESTTAIHPDQEFDGIFSRIEGSNVILEAVEGRADYDAAGSIATAIGTVTPLAETIVSHVIEAGGTFAWDDFRTTGIRTRGPSILGWRSAISTIFTAGRATYNLTFASREPSKVPFGSSDFAYIQILASFFNRHLREEWQYERLTYQQSHDVLTGLPNRSYFRSLARTASTPGTGFAIVLLDIDSLRGVNESYGSLIGDAMLVEVGAALKSRAADDEIVGRVAGDVFAVYVAGASAARTVRDRALYFVEVFSQAFSTGDRDGCRFIALTASVGVAIAPQDGATIEAVLSHADLALAAAKERGPGSLMLFAAGMEGDAGRRATLRAELLAAIANDQFELYYQPHVDLRSGEAVGCEALIRWHHPTRGFLLPAEFIPFAEENGIITAIDDWVMRHAFVAGNELSAARPRFRLFFNLSGRQAGDPAVVRAFVAAARTGVRIGNLGVEITETDVMRDVDATRHVCRALRRLGVAVAIDDFGVGYSSLASMDALPVDIVKVDRSFIAGAASDLRKASIAQTIIDISQRFGFTTLGEGIEDEADANWLRTTSCQLVQGYLYARPMTLEALKIWLNERGFRRLGTMSAAELESSPFGAIVIDLDGTIRSYNQYEADLSRLDPQRLLGKNFFRDVAPCTAVQGFEGRMREFAATPEHVSESFRYFFPFAHGDVDVEVRFVKRSEKTLLILVERFQEPS